MRRLWQKLGAVLYWLSWPAIWVYLHGSQRSRVLLVAGEQALVVRDWLGDGRWNLPGGGINKGETAEQALLREVIEETGISLNPKNLKSLATEQCHVHGHEFTAHYFVAHLDRPLPVSFRFPEIVEAAWVGIGQLKPNNTSNDVLRALELWLG